MWLRGTLAAGLVLALVELGPGQTSSSVTQDGRFWTQTATGSVSAQPMTHIRVIANGNITVNGTGGDRVAYTLKRRIRAVSAQEAERQLRGFEVRSSTRGEWIYLTVTSPSSKIMSADLTVGVPRWMHQLQVESYDGNVTASDFDGEVEVNAVGGNVELDRIKQSVVARTGGGNIILGKVAGPVKCYSGGGNVRADSIGGECWLETGGGDLSVNEANGTVHVFTRSGGNIKVGRSTGAVYAQTAGGLIEVGQAAGLVEAQNSGGSIQVNRANGVQCQSIAGAIRLRNVDGPLRASTSAGSIIAELLSGHRIEESILSAKVGDITVLIPSNIPMTVMARNQTPGMGRIVSDFPEIRVRQVGGALPAIAEGSLNGGGPVFTIAVNAGTIYLRKK